MPSEASNSVPDLRPDVLIAGAGPVGLTAALELGRRGHSCRIIDTDGTPAPQSRALGIHARTLDILEPSGITEILLAEGNRLNQFIFRFGTTAIARLGFSRLAHRYNFILTLPQSRTEEILIDALQKQGIAIEWFTRLESFEEARHGLPGHGLQCKLTSEGGTETVKTDFLIGADGAHSTVRKALDLGFPGESLPHDFGLADVTLRDWSYPPDTAVATVMHDYVVAYLPMGEDHGRFVSTRPDTLNRLPPEARVDQVLWETNFRISYRQVETYQKGNAFLAGDAAHIHSPVGGRGMNLGIEDAATLAWLISSGKTEDYTRLRHPVAADVLHFTARQTRQLTRSNPSWRMLQRIVIPLALKIPSIERLALTRLTGLDTPFPPWLEPHNP